MRKKEIQQQEQWNAKVSLFAWAYIPLIFTLICVGLLAFYGLMYQTSSKVTAGLLATVIVLLTLGAAIFTQHVKAAHKDFEKWRKVEKAMQFAVLPIVVILAMMPTNYFLLIVQDSKQIEQSFSKGMEQSDQLFTHYEQYVDTRLANYKQQLIQTDSLNLLKNNFEAANRLATLDLQLRPTGEYMTQKESALEWLHQNTIKPSVWNPFLIANTQMVKDALNQWIETLDGYSKTPLKYENKPRSFKEANMLNEVFASLDAVEQLTKSQSGLAWLTIPTALIVYVLLLLPTLTQSRHTKTGYGNYDFQIRRKKKGNATVVEQRISTPQFFIGTYKDINQQ